jgi:hypothetical protein
LGSPIPAHYTKAFERYVLELSQFATIKDIADRLGVRWDLIKDIQNRHLARRYRAPKLKHLKQIAIDEISLGKGHRYLTLVLCLDTGAVVFVAVAALLRAPELTELWQSIRKRRSEPRAGGAS